MPESLPPLGGGADAERTAARWALRCAEGLSAEEERALAEWIAADPRHARLLAEYRGAWERFDPLAAAAAENQAEVAAERSRHSAGRQFLRFAVPALAAAALAALGLWWRAPVESASPPRVAEATAPGFPAPCERRTLDDGTVVELNRGAEVAVEFTTETRRVRLLRGEASFDVAKDPARPFVVAAGAVEARAVGTAFNVRWGATAVEIVVTEGIVQVAGPAAPTAPAGDTLLVTAGQQVLVAVAAPAAASAAQTLTAAELEQRLAWQPRLLEFDNASLAEITAAFNRRNPVHLVIDDPVLAARRMTATFRSDNVESFVRLLEGNYGIRATARPDGGILLSRR